MTAEAAAAPGQADTSWSFTKTPSGAMILSMYVPAASGGAGAGVAGDALHP